MTVDCNLDLLQINREKRQIRQASFKTSDYLFDQYLFKRILTLIIHQKDYYTIPVMTLCCINPNIMQVCQLFKIVQQLNKFLR